jgi:hypothetical protein
MLGLVKLGMTRAQARHAYVKSTNRGKRYEDFFCLTPIGVRVGYGSPALLRIVPSAARSEVRGRVVWASTSNPRYAIAGIRSGATIASTRAALPKGALFDVGHNDWYLVRSGPVTAIFKERGGIVQEIGIADRRVTATTHDDRSFLRSFS